MQKICKKRGSLRNCNKLPIIFGLGLALFAFHSPLVTFHRGEEVWFFMPQFAFMLILGVLAIFWITEKFDYGPKKIWIPLLIISISPLITALFKTDIETLAGGLLGLVLFFSYLYARKYGKESLNIFFWPIIIVSISVIIYSIFIRPDNAIRTGGLLSPTNYDILAGFLFFGILCYTGKHKWILVLFGLIAIYFSGSSEALFGLIILTPVLLWKRDFSKKLLITILILIPIILINSFIGRGILTWERAYTDASNSPVFFLKEFITTDHVEYEKIMTDNRKIIKQNKKIEDENNKIDLIKTDIEGSWLYRKDSIVESFERFSPVGHGYIIFPIQEEKDRPKIVHNVPLIILDQIGILGFICWIWVTLYCLIKTKWRYAWIGLLSLCVFDHYFWTTLCFYWWILVGTSLANPNINDYIYKENKL